MSLPPSAEKVRIRIDPEIHEQARQAAQTRGMAVGDYLEFLVRQDADAEARQAEKLAAAKGDRAMQRIEAAHANLDSLGAQFRHALDSLRSDVPKALEAGFAGIRSHISNTGGTAHLRDMITKAEARSQARFEASHAAIVTKLEESHKTLCGMMDRESRARRSEKSQRSFHAGLGAGAVLLLFLLAAFFLPNSTPTRWLAIRLVGATDQFRAASNLLDGDNETGRLLLRTQVLLNGQKNFRSDYRACIERVEKASERFICKVRFDRLPSSKRSGGS